MRKSAFLKASRSTRMAVELLEQRMLLHAGHSHDPVSQTDHADLDSATALEEAVHVDDQMQQFLAGLQNTDPHNQVDARFDEPVDFDELLGLPTGQGGGPEEDWLPDFFPSLSGGFSTDQTSQPGRVLVRFGTQVNNQGLGPGILISGRPGDSIPTGAPITSWVNPDGSQNVLQAIYNYNGSSFVLSHYLAGGRFTYHDGHGHFHYDGYADYRLRYNVGGVPGDLVQRADGTGTVGGKVGFCLININSSFTMENGQNSTTLPTYNRPGQPSTGCGLVQGVHVGKADVYSSGLQGQWIDVTGIPNGQYFFEIELDGGNAILESNETNNAKTFPLTINVNPPSGGITPDPYDTSSHNDTFGDATDMGVMGTYSQTGLNIHWGQDYDYFRFEASSSGNANINATIASGDVNLYLYNADYELLRSSTNPGGNETVTYNFQKGETYYVMARSYNSTTSNNYSIGWNLKPETSSTTSVALAAETGEIGRFVIARNGPATSPITVQYTLSGTATNGVDYQLVSSSVTIGNLAHEAEIEIIPIADGDPEGLETVILTITSNNAYVVGATGSQVTISERFGDFDEDGQLTTGDIDLLVAAIASGSGDPAIFDVTVDGAVDLDDLNEWLVLAGILNLPSGAPYLAGDANLDGAVDGSDFNLWNSHKFTPTAAWSAGDFNADGVVDGSDFNIWNSNKFTMSDRGRQATSMATPSYFRTQSAWLNGDGKEVEDERMLRVLEKDLFFCEFQ